MQGMEQTWRWYGPDDPVTLDDIRQAGATGIVTALHAMPIDEVWPVAAILKRKRLIEFDDAVTPPKRRGLVWSVIESVPVHEDIKMGLPTRARYIDNYQQTLRNAGQCGVRCVCFNFMPVLDWTRTDLAYELEDGSRALRFDADEFAAFDLFILRRPDAAKTYTAEQVAAARRRFEAMTPDQRALLQHNIISGLPGGQQGYTLAEFQAKLDAYRNVTEQKFRENLTYFLRAIAPVAEEAGVKLAIHPDDPPSPLFEEDLRQLSSVHDSVYNGFTLCTGSLGVRPDNDLVGIVKRLGSKLNFAHLRSTQRDENGSFFEAAHLQGDVDMFRVIREIHGHTILDDLEKKTNPGYSAIGLLRGMAELRGLEMGIVRSESFFKE